MTNEYQTVPETAVPQRVGAQLRAAREACGLSLEQVSARTRISERHIAHIEAGEYDSLPGRAYATGFARSIAAVVGLDRNKVAAMVRAEMGGVQPDGRNGEQFEPGDPSRAPSRRLVWFSLFALALLAAGLFVAARQLFAPAAELPSLIEQEQAEQAAREARARPAAANAGPAGQARPTGPVVITAGGTAWVRFYDAQGRILKEGEMAEGESFTIPADAQGPQVLTGRPDLLSITVGGRAIAPLSDRVETVSGVPVDAASLLARSGNAPTPPQGSGAPAAPAAQRTAAPAAAAEPAGD